ncbi:MAG: LysM peptidoglycan-binding domain-containing protein [Chloroflexi bacterium]|nr:LysM peptidoglycan-binding domain-containing protein [Chloroflexota bacterium]
MHNRWGIHAPNAGFRRMDDFFAAGFHNYTVLHVNENLIPQIRAKYPNARILVRYYLQNWFNQNPADWAREITDTANRLRPVTNELTWANEQNLDLEGHPQGASPSQPVPPASLYQDIHKWNLEMIQRLRESIPWARLHYPAFANDHSDDKNQGGYVGLEICRGSIQLADVMDCHCYWRADDGPLTLDGGQRFVLTHNLFPEKPMFISECGNFAVHDPRSPEQYVTFMHSLYNYAYVEGATFFIWDSDAAPENALNVIQRSGALVKTLREVSKDAPVNLPPVPAAPPPIARPQPTPTPTQPVPPGGIEYIVVPGDTLLAIARRFGVDLVLLMNVNAIADARLLRAGQRLRIPGVTSQPTLPTPPIETKPSAGETSPMPAPTLSGTIYIVRGGDTLSAIAVRFNVTVQALVVANNLPRANLIRPGQQLVIPQAAMVLSIAETEAILESSAPQFGVLGIGDPATPIVSAQEIRAFLQNKRTTFYVTRKGDTLSRIAALFKMDALVLAQINRVGMQGEIIPGTRLIIPMK